MCFSWTLDIQGGEHKTGQTKGTVLVVGLWDFPSQYLLPEWWQLIVGGWVIVEMNWRLRCIFADNSQQANSHLCPALIIVWILWDKNSITTGKYYLSVLPTQPSCPVQSFLFVSLFSCLTNVLLFKFQLSSAAFLRSVTWLLWLSPVFTDVAGLLVDLIGSPQQKTTVK